LSQHIDLSQWLRLHSPHGPPRKLHINNKHPNYFFPN
jgi:hypothetical protein